MLIFQWTISIEWSLLAFPHSAKTDNDKELGIRMCRNENLLNRDVVRMALGEKAAVLLVSPA